MKFDAQKSFGYPVLRPGSEDYLQADFQSGIGLGINEENELEYVLSYDIAIGVAEIRDLVKAKKASIQIEVNCRTTFYGRLYEVKAAKGSISIHADLVRGGLDISCYVIAKKAIPAFVSKKINPEFNDSHSSFPAYAVLACDAPIHYWVDREAFRNITSIFDYREDPQMSEGSWRLNLDEERVAIIVSPTQHQILKMAQVTKPNQAIIANSFVFAAILEIVNTLKGENDYVERRWAQNVLAKCAALGITLNKTTDSIDVAQKLMTRPLGALNAHVFKVGDEN